MSENGKTSILPMKKTFVKRFVDVILPLKGEMAHLNYSVTSHLGRRRG